MCMCIVLQVFSLHFNFRALDKGDSSSIQEPLPSKSSSTLGETASANVTSAGGNSESLSFRTSTPPKLQHKEAMKLLEEYFPEAFSRKPLHSYYTCSGRGFQTRTKTTRKRWQISAQMAIWRNPSVFKGNRDVVACLHWRGGDVLPSLLRT